MTTQLLERTQATDATETLYDRHHRRLRGYCLGQLRDREEANDAVQSTFLYAFAALQRGVAPRNELPWLFTIAHNVCRTQRRSLRRRGRLEAGVDIDSLSETVGRNDPSRDELAELGSSLAALPENQRRALLLREWQGLSYAEVAERMGLTESAVEAVLFRARRSLAQKLRATDRVASLISGAFFIRSFRRVGSMTGSGKLAAAAIAVGLGTGAAIQPLVTSPRHAAPTPRHAGQIQRTAPRVAGRAPAAIPSAGHRPRATTASIGADRYSARQNAGTPNTASAEPQGGQAQEPAGSADDTQKPVAAATTPQNPSQPYLLDPGRNAADVQPARPKAPDVTRVLPSRVRDVLTKVALPSPDAASETQPPSLPPTVTNVVQNVAPNLTPPNPPAPSAPADPSLLAASPSVTSALPDVPPLPNPSVPR
jgi:RNA polymerase sigma factor (sigma-70 family)